MEPEEDPLLHKLKERRAFEIWQERGSPVGEAGKAAEAENWYAASACIEQRIKDLAYKFWVESGSPKGEEGARASPMNRDRAIRQLYSEMIGQDPSPSKVEPAGLGGDWPIPEPL
jgi:hypothetical protein